MILRGEFMKICKAEKCNREARKNGYCEKHYFQIRNHGRLTPEREHNTKVKTCKVKGCNSLNYGHGYCRKHYYQIKDHGCIYKSRFDLNEYNERENYIEMVIFSKGKKIIVLIDKDDYSKVKNIKRGMSNKYIDGSVGKLHRFVMNLTDPNLQVDHINGNTLDNRKHNLRICTNQQNNFNKGLYRHNTSGVTGVTYASNIKKWIARIKISGKTINLGSFEDKGDAIKARRKAELKYFGEYSYLNRNNII